MLLIYEVETTLVNDMRAKALINAYKRAAQPTMADIAGDAPICEAARGAHAMLNELAHYDCTPVAISRHAFSITWLALKTSGLAGYFQDQVYTQGTHSKSNTLTEQVMNAIEANHKQHSNLLLISGDPETIAVARMHEIPVIGFYRRELGDLLKAQDILYGAGAGYMIRDHTELRTCLGWRRRELFPRLE